jgi:hypothetical protein
MVPEKIGQEQRFRSHCGGGRLSRPEAMDPRSLGAAAPRPQFLTQGLIAARQRSRFYLINTIFPTSQSLREPKPVVRRHR